MSEKLNLKIGVIGANSNKIRPRAITLNESIDLIKKKNYPKDIEDLVLSDQSVLECSCIGIDDKYFGEVIMVVIVPRDINTFNLTYVKKLCREQLADFQQPMAYEILSELPKNNMGKIMKYKLKEKFIWYDATKILRKLLGMNDE